MGTTLQNGVYLPNEGERNCYAGLKTNWEILDQKVADVTALQQAVAGALHREIVASLPTTDIDPNTIYMILSGTSATENVYDEYMYVNNAWELIGTSATDLTNYYTKGEVDGLLLLKANASDLTSHTGDTTIHVTASDKSKWNTVALIKQLRLVNTQVGSATTIAFANIDDTNGIKVGDKCMDLDAKMFEITAVDTTNQTVTVGTALIDLALDANVVHTSGNETISGDKVFNNRLIKNIDVVLGTAPSTGKFSNIDIADNNKSSLLQVLGGVYDTGNSYARFFVQNKTADDGSGLSPTGTIRACGFNINLPATSTSEGQGSITPRANKATDFGLLSYQWRNLWCEKLFLNGTQLDPSAFVTTDTAQTISGTKTFLDVPITLKSSTAELGVTGGNTKVIFTDKNLLNLAGITFGNYGSSKLSYCRFYIYDKDSNNQEVENFIEFSYVNNNQVAYFRPNKSNFVTLGTVNNRWSKVYADEYYYGSNSVEFSTKFVTTDTNQTVGGQKTFTNSIILQNSDTSGLSRDLFCKSQIAVLGDAERGDNTKYRFVDKNNNEICYIRQRKLTNSNTDMSFCVNNIDNDNNSISAEINFIIDRNNDPRISPSVTDSISLGRPTFRWKNIYSNLINGLTPSSLSLPATTGIVDISGYVTDLTGNTVNTYSPVVNGYIVITCNSNDVDFIKMSNNLDFVSVVDNTNNQFTSGLLGVWQPCVAGIGIQIRIKASALNSARFIPCQGNI